MGWDEDRLSQDAMRSFLGELLRPPAWHRDAACLEHPELHWFPERGEGPVAAQAVCAGCLVVDDCLSYALAHDERYGVWGGMTGKARKGLTGAQEAA